MREILFRGKRIDNCEWVYGYYYKELDDSSKIVSGGGFTWDCNPILIYVEVDPNTVGQYTGLKDKNDVMIYEGDVVSFGNIGTKIIKHEIKEKSETWGHGSSGTAISYGFCIDDYYGSFDKMQVIGNIHDTPQGDNA